MEIFLSFNKKKEKKKRTFHICNLFFSHIHTSIYSSIWYIIHSPNSADWQVILEFFIPAPFAMFYINDNPLQHSCVFESERWNITKWMRDTWNETIYRGREEREREVVWTGEQVLDRGFPGFISLLVGQLKLQFSGQI